MIKEIAGFAYDCKNSQLLVDFYVKLLGWGKILSEGGWAGLRSPYGWIFAFEEVEEYIPPAWPQLMGVSFEGITAYEIPIVFAKGRQDYHVSALLAKAYFDTITTAKEFHWFERSAHFPQWSETKKFYQMMKALKNRS